uniref:Uncharacterized protein n=1 Tax=uncultured prokaryote TaxID=198431 RepID=A0A0H5QJW6_9ZZZZ|nr:hypothetical protein [uncultured prokaryote]
MPISFFRVRILGNFVSGEQWSINPTFSYTGNVSTIPDQTDMQDFAEGVRDGAQLPATALALLSSAGRVVGVRTEFYNTAGVLSRAAEALNTTPVAGTGTATNPSQSSVVVSLLTGIPGRRYRGRLYLPALAPAFNATTLRLTNTLPAQIATQMAAWMPLVASQWAGGDELDPVVVSQVGAVATPITTVKVGDVIDTQRRRRDQLIENYASAPVV